MDDNLRKRLILLAEKYEVSSFCQEDPSQFLSWYSCRRDVEIASFIAAMLSFGNRKQFIPKIREIFELADSKCGSICRWIESCSFEQDFNSPNGYNKKKFYRFYSYEDMKVLFSRLSDILNNNENFGEAVRLKWEKKKSDRVENLASVIGDFFYDCKIVPKGKNSANKRVHMFLRWMVRQNSPVDLGLWNWYSPADLIIPLDTHVLQESEKFGLIEKAGSADLKTAVHITEALKQIWPEDPCKGDFALFGLGVDS